MSTVRLDTDKMEAEIADGIGWVTFANPARHNAMSTEMNQAIPAIIEVFSADQGSSGSRNDGTEAFDIPNECQAVLKIFKSASPGVVLAGGELTFSLEARSVTKSTR